MTPEPSHFENPLAEQRQLLAGEAILPWRERSVIEVVGANAKSWLHSLLSQNLVNLKSGESTEALLLDPQGRVEQLVRVIVATDERVLLTAPSAKVEALLNWLRKMIFRSGVQLKNVTEEFQVVGAFAPIAEFAAAPVFVDSWPKARPGGARYSEWNQPFSYREYLLPPEQTLPNRLRLAGQLAFDALRIWAGRPVIEDLDERSLPHEFDLLTSAVHMSKGCYRGQESVAKVHNLGHPPRRLVLLEFDAAELLPQPGEVVVDAVSGREVGKLLVAGQHFEAGPIALALVSRVTISDAELIVKSTAGDLRATQQILVPPTAGATAPRPKLPKLHLGSKR